LDEFVLLQVFESVGFLSSRLGISPDFVSLFSKRALDLEVGIQHRGFERALLSAKFEFEFSGLLKVPFIFAHRNPPQSLLSERRPDAAQP
jgi:hypothetical protein